MMKPIDNTDIFAATVYKVLSEYFDINLYRPVEERIYFWGTPLLRKRGWKRKLTLRLSMIRAGLKIKRDGEQYCLTVSPLSKAVGLPPPKNIILFLLTFITVLMAASIRESGLDVLSNPALLLKGIPFTVTLLSILLVHEMGHFIAGFKRGVVMSYPFFIPAPTFLGTFGALIRARTPITNRNDLILIGASGPLAGAVVSIIALFWGYTTSTLVPLPEGSVIFLGDSLLTWLFQVIIFGDIPPGLAVHLSSIALAGHFGLLVTMINLLPLGQLDGGHIFYGLIEKRQKTLAIIFLVFLFVLGFQWPGWWLWMILATAMRPFHPPVINRDQPLDSRHKKIGWTAVFLFIITFVPMPIS